MKTTRTGEYQSKGDYHLRLDSSWPFLPVYLAKMEYISQYLDQIDPKSKVIDLGCGEGVLVNKYFNYGYNIQGVDLNYQSRNILKGNILKLKFPDRSYDLVLCLDLLEHLNYAEQILALSEISRILKPKGTLILSVPNLSHLASRFSFMFLGKLLRTSAIQRHPGDRPLAEYLNILKPNFKLRKTKGLFPTFPLISIFTLLFPSKVIWLHKIYNYLFNIPSICFENIVIAEKN